MYAHPRGDYEGYQQGWYFVDEGEDLAGPYGTLNEVRIIAEDYEP